MNFTNRDLEKAFKKSLVQIKRWASICLGSDPLAGQSGGVRREYDIDSAFIIYLFGIVLVGEFHLGLKEAKIHIDNISSLLKEEALLPSKIDTKNENLNFMPSALIIKAIEYKSTMQHYNIPNFPLISGIDLTIMPGYDYFFEKSIYVYVGKIDGYEEYQVFKYRKRYRKGTNLREKGPHYFMPLIFHIDTFNHLISSVS